MCTNLKAKVTVVMAVYNSSKFLNKSIDSVLKQSLTDWKLICVDDGSIDNSLEILHKYENRDFRITVLSKENGGPASAREFAYKIVDTPYVVSLDSDDEYAENFLELLVNRAEETNADSVAPNLLIEQKDGSLMNWNESYGWNSNLDVELTGNEAFEKTFINATMHGVNLWKTKLVKQIAVGENANYNKLNEDEYIQRLLFLNCKKVVFADTTYYYNNNQQSISKKFRVKQLGYLDTCKKYLHLVYSYNLSSNVESMIREYYMRHIVALRIRYYKNRNNLDKVSKMIVSERIRKEYDDVIKYKNDIRFEDKKFPWLYRFSCLNGYFVFDLSCFLFSFIKK